MPFTVKLDRWLFALTLAVLGTSREGALAQVSQPVITAVRLEPTNLVVEVQVPPGLRRLTLESRARFGAGAWEPRAVARLEGRGDRLTLRLPRNRALELIRARADTQAPLPAAFYGGTNWFANQNGGVVGMGPAGIDDANGTGSGPTRATREVVESDIWKIAGNTLFFFNQYRGLQVIDLTQPDAAVVRGTLELPAAGEQMYLCDSNHVVLLARASCAGGEGSQVILVAVSQGTPRIVASLPVDGTIQESRMVGTALYVASQSYRGVPGSLDGTWEWGTRVASFDLADPEHPAARDTLWFAGYGNVVAATDTFLFVANQNPTNWTRSLIQVIDITAPDGRMAAYGSVAPTGRIPDKFKMNHAAAVFTTIAEDWPTVAGGRLTTWLETFRLPAPDATGTHAIVKLGQLALGQGEQLHATRFDGDRVYVVTFLRIDPLWVVDLADPTRPQLAGKLEVPGWSTYIEPLGDRLVAVGVESNRAAVSLFDVHDTTRPALLSKVGLGESYSWSEANTDEKAFTVLADAGLILLPYSGNTTNGWASRVQLIDLNPTTLVARGVIEHQFQPRRATLFGDRILSLSGMELLSADATDRDHPIVRGDTVLAWSVNRVFLWGDFLIEVAGQAGWYGNQDPPKLQVAPALAPDQIAGELVLTNWTLLGAAAQGDHLFVAQGRPNYAPVPPPGGGPLTNEPNFLLTVVGLKHLPRLEVLGQVAVKSETLGWWSQWEGVWPKSNLLVWAGASQFYSWWWWGGPVDGGIVPGGGLRFWPIGQLGSGGLLAFDVHDPSAPGLVSELDLSSSNRWGFSPAFTADGLVYLSHQTAEYLPPPAPGTNPPSPGGDWVQRSYVDVVDYADPAHPLAREPASIPGRLQGLSHRGNVLYTVGTHWRTNSVYDWTEWLDASAYDGVSARLIDSLALSADWPHPVLVLDANLFIGWPSSNPTNAAALTNRIETWTLGDDGKFTPRGRTFTTLPVTTLVSHGQLLVASESDSTLDLFDASIPAALRRVGQAQPPGCVWPDLVHADGALGRGLWMPLGTFGIGRIEAGP